MDTKSIITDELIERLKRQEEKLFAAHKEALNQWYGGILIFSGLVVAALANQNNVWAYLFIVLWLLEVLLIVYIFRASKDAYDLVIIRHYEGTTSEEQEKSDLKYAEHKHNRVKIFDKAIFYTFFILTLLTIGYFISQILIYNKIIV